MNAAHWHLILNHIPLVGIGFVILLMIIALARKSPELKNVAQIFTVIVALWAIPSYLTGEPAEEIVEDMPGISEDSIHEHEEFAEKAFIFIEVVGGIALIALIGGRFNKKLGNTLAVVTLVGLIAGGGLIAWTANLGGKIHHQEIRGEKTALSPPAGDANKEDND
ncbi:MAG: hypothetical protein A3J42_09380 [Candidatus Dadabacteria bacterium RIFCSPHIGHO2_12_FULL_53_21]|nr:MAG: hypothetical protein A3J42_09380 [Candidatus Dadabacteria bacterium RIFCSPHIGHO2_12_FULL_53_21]